MNAPAGVFPSGTPNVSAAGTLQNVNDAVTLNTDTLGAVGVNLTGTNVGSTVVFEGTINGAAWDTIKVYPLVAGAAGVTSASAAGDFEFNCAAFKQVRARLSVAGAGSFTAALNGTVAPKHIGVKNGNAADLNATVVGSVPDSTGNYPLNPDALAHTYTYNGSGLLASDSCTNGTYTWVKTYSYTGMNLTGESAWVKQ